MIRLFLAWGAIAGGVSVVLGAFASHALKGKLLERSLEIFETGTRYQMYHALALLLVAALLSQFRDLSLWLGLSGLAFMVGMVLFSGSLYLLAVLGIEWMGAITPVGGAAFIAGWGCLAIAALSLQLPAKP